MRPGHERGRPRQVSDPVSSTTTGLPHGAGLRPLPRQHLDDINAAIQCGIEMRIVEEIEVRAEARAREILLEQAGEWRSATYALAIEKGPDWAAMMLEVIDGDESEVA